MLRRRRAAAIAALIILPFGPPGLYIALGSPNVPGEPAFARVKTPQGHELIASLVSKVEAHLARDPNDGSGWEVIAPVYMRLGRFDDAVAARKKIAGAQRRHRNPTGRSRRGDDRRRQWRGHRRSQGGIRARHGARSARSESPLFSRSRRRAGRQERGRPLQSGARCLPTRRPARRGSNSCARRCARGGGQSSDRDRARDQAPSDVAAAANMS